MNLSARMKIISECEAFSGLTEEAIRRLAEESRFQKYDFGAVILRTGEAENGIFLIKSGKVRLFAEIGGKEKSVFVLNPGMIFGENSLFRKQGAEYSARSSLDTEILFLPADSIHQAISSEDPGRRHLFEYAVKRIVLHFLSASLNLDQKTAESVYNHLPRDINLRKVSRGEKIVKEEGFNSEDLFFIRNGEIQLAAKENGSVYSLISLGPGDFFGEILFRENKQFAVSPLAKTDATLLVIPGKTIENILRQNENFRQTVEDQNRIIEKELVRLRELNQTENKKWKIDIRSKPRRGERILRRFPLVHQTEEADCGAACLAMICKYYDIPASVGKIHEQMDTSPEGVNMDSLARAAEKLGFVTNGSKSVYDSIREFELPFIAHWEGFHYIVIYGISKNRVWAADPAKGFCILSREEFERGWTGFCLLLVFSEQTFKPNEPKSPLYRFGAYLKPFKKILFDLLLAAFIIQILGLAPPIIIQNIIDQVVVHQDFELLNILIAGLAIAFLFHYLSSYVSAYLANFMMRKLDFNMMSSFHKHVFSLPLAFFTKRKTGDILARFHENATVRRFMTVSSIRTVLNTLMLFTYFILMFIYNVKLTVMLIVFIPPIVALSLLAAPKYKDFSRKTFYAGAEAESRLVESLGNFEVVKGMGLERDMRLKWEKKYIETLNISYRAEMFAVLISTLSGLLRTGALLTLLWTGARMVLNQELTIGQLMAFYALIGNVMGPILGLVAIWDELQEVIVSMERLGDVLDLEAEQEVSETAAKVVLPKVSGNIQFDGVYFSYDKNGSSNILKNIRFQISEGTSVALVGKSGSGKTTLAKLMTGMYLPTEGKVLIDEYDLSNLDLYHIRKQIGYVMQTNTLFSGTVSENIALGDPNPAPMKVIEAARLADADGFIRNLPKGYEQLVGERGAGLSTGQIQRICIARAIYHDPSIMILDEATSSLDSESESIIQNNLRRQFQNRTVITIAHRVATIMNADRIFVLYQGEIAEQGNHLDLINKKGMYYHLIKEQVA